MLYVDGVMSPPSVTQTWGFTYYMKKEKKEEAQKKKKEKKEEAQKKMKEVLETETPPAPGEWLPHCQLGRIAFHLVCCCSGWLDLARPKWQEMHL